MARLETLLGEEQRREIAAAVAAAELRTGGEIVPYLVEACDDYDEACWKAAAFGAVAAALLAAIVWWLGGYWRGGAPFWIGLPAAGGAALAWLAARLVAPLRRALVPEATLDLRARRRAMAAFVEEEVFDTRERSGILILVALFEHRVVVLGDAGINRAVGEEAWQGIVELIVAGVKEGRLAAALVAAIGECGELLERHGVELRPDDEDELANEPRLRER